ncbi:MAG TPA: hypothetical protein PLM33_00885 [Acidobacteriota bacterium]|nr:hypothetical protein [Acidobacteriota bacterium]
MDGKASDRLRDVRWLSVVVGAVILVLGTGSARARDWTPARVSLVEGTAAYEPAGDVDWSEVSVNLPILDGDRIITHPDSRIEVELGGGAFLRLGASTDVHFVAVQDDDAVVELRSGDVILRLADSRDVTIQTQAGRFVTGKRGLYRVSADEQGVVEAVVRKGKGRFESSYGTKTLRDNEVARVDLGADPVLRVAYGYYPDAFDQWSERLDARYVGGESVRYVGSYYPGLYELDLHGYWIHHASYGHVWIPYVSVGWSPFFHGRWVHFGFGWTWISYEPWGWLPYHYGHWAFYDHRWCWVPGGFRAWSPAIAHFYHFGGYVGWVPRFHPRVGFVDRDLTIINNNITVVNGGRGISSDVVRRSLVVVRKEDFGRTRIDERVVVRNVRFDSGTRLQPGLPSDLARPSPSLNRNQTVTRVPGTPGAGQGNSPRTGVVRTPSPRDAAISPNRTTVAPSLAPSSRTGVERSTVTRSPARDSAVGSELRVYRVPSGSSSTDRVIGSSVGPRTEERLRTSSPTVGSAVRSNLRSGSGTEGDSGYVRPSNPPRTSVTSPPEVRIPSSRAGSREVTGPDTLRSPASRLSSPPSQNRSPSTVRPPAGYSATSRSGLSRTPAITSPAPRTTAPRISAPRSSAPSIAAPSPRMSSPAPSRAPDSRPAPARPRPDRQ